MQKTKKAFIFNLIIVVLEILSVIWMMSGIKLREDYGTLSAERLKSLKYFTIDSNILMGLFSLIAAVEELNVLKGKKEDISKITYVLKFVGVVGVTLTMLVTIFFLTPTGAAKYGLFGYFKNSNLFLHLINPVISLVCFLCFERTDKIKFPYTFAGLIPMAIYSVYYGIVSVLHMENGIIVDGYDWYGFLKMGVKSIVIVVPIFFLITYFVGFVIWKLNRRSYR